MCIIHWVTLFYWFNDNEAGITIVCFGEWPEFGAHTVLVKLISSSKWSITHATKENDWEIQTNV